MTDAGGRSEALHSFRTLEGTPPRAAAELDAKAAHRHDPAADGAPLLQVRNLSVAFATRIGGAPRPIRSDQRLGDRRSRWRGDRRGALRVVQDVSFDLARGEVLALVGESGSGKSVCAMTLMGLTRGPLTAISGSAQLDGQELLSMSDAQLRRIRGRRMSMVFQDPQSSLNPVHRVGDQIAEQIRAHSLKNALRPGSRPGEPPVSKGVALQRAAELMERVGIADARARVRSYPHELSGGQRQRVMIAMALSLGAPLLLADEPTTALDVTVQAKILAELRELRDRDGLGIVLITHDFGIVAGLADRVAVMRAGRIVEQGPTERVLDAPADAYTRGLLDALAVSPRRRPPAPAPAPGDGTDRPRAELPSLLEIEGLRVTYERSRHSHEAPALDGVDLSVAAGETLAIVGESGCGKTTLLRSIARLVEPDSGSIRFEGSLGMVFQDPQSSLNPRRRVGRTLERALLAAGHGREEARARALVLLTRVGLTDEHAGRYPHELSGGQRQRVTIARALAGEPRLVLLDEPVSSLDAALRRGVVDLLDELQEQLRCAYVVVSHDLAAVEATADRIAVMRSGRIVELGDAERVRREPSHPYTRELLASRPHAHAATRRDARASFASGGLDRVPSSGWAEVEISRQAPREP